jgi:hypothetical protein
LKPSVKSRELKTISSLVRFGAKAKRAVREEGEDEDEDCVEER